jgi:hypothetical protein
LYEVISDSELAFDEKVDVLMRLGCQQLGTEFAMLSRLDGDEYVFEHVHSPNGEIQPGDRVHLGDTMCENAVLDSRTLVVDDVREARNLTEGAALELACYVGAPVYREGDVCGTFCFYDVEARSSEFSDWEVTLVDLMSRWISNELQRMEVREELERENERLEDFASMVSHGLRNPVKVAYGHARMMQDENPTESLEHILVALERGEEIIDDALTWARTGSGVDEPQPESLRDVAQASWEMVEHGDLTLEVDTEQTIRADETRLRQLLENLFSNAVEHGGNHVTAGDLDHGFFVEDDGPGLPDDEPVFDAAPPRTTEPGSGSRSSNRPPKPTGGRSTAGREATAGPGSRSPASNRPAPADPDPARELTHP